MPKVLPTPAAAGIRAAFRAWPHGSLDAMANLGLEYPRDPVVQLYRGIALLWAGYGSDAVAPLEQGEEARPRHAVGGARPTTCCTRVLRELPAVPAGRPPPEPAARRGARLQAQGHQHSAEKLFQRAARQAPNDAEAQVAAAVGRFDKDNLSASFSRLGPLTQRFPRSQSVRYYLGLLLAWTGQRDPALTQFRKTVALGPRTELGQGGAGVPHRDPEGWDQAVGK